MIVVEHLQYLSRLRVVFNIYWYGDVKWRPTRSLFLPQQEKHPYIWLGYSNILFVRVICQKLLVSKMEKFPDPYGKMIRFMDL